MFTWKQSQREQQAVPLRDAAQRARLPATLGQFGAARPRLKLGGGKAIALYTVVLALAMAGCLAGRLEASPGTPGWRNSCHGLVRAASGSLARALEGALRSARLPTELPADRVGVWSLS